MRAWIIKAFGAPSDETFSLSELPDPKPSQDEILIRVIACGVCHTDLDELEGRVRPSLLPIVPGHQIIGEIVDLGHEVKNLKKGQVVGLGWIYHTCGTCPYCSKGLENLCANFKGTGKDVNGGYAEYVLAKEDYVFTVPNVGEEIVNLAPLFCAGSIGYRAFLEYALKFKIRPEVAIYPFEEALQALRDIKAHKTRGAKVIKIV